jgi:hypothetical protein
MSWLFSRALVEAFSAASCSDGELSAPSNGSLTPQAYLPPDRTTAIWSLSRFGMTCAPLTEGRGAELLMSYLEAFRARTSAPPASVKASPASAAGSGSRWLGLLARYDRASSSLKTAQTSLIEGSESSSLILPEWGSMRDGECFQLAPLVPHTHGKDCFYWHTPTTNEKKPAGEKEMAEVTRWLAGESVKNTYIRLRSLLAARCGLRLPPNPEFLEWLMGWPIGWGAITPSGTDRFQQWRQQHGEFLL